METKKKVSGIPNKQSQNVQNKLKSVIDNIYSHAIHFKLTHDDIADEIHSKVFNSDQIKKTPKWVAAYLHGYWEAKRAELYKYHIVWMLYVDDKLLTSKGVSLLADQDVAVFGVTNQSVKGAWSRVNADLSRHVWKDSFGNPMKDKPFDKRFVSL